MCPIHISISVNPVPLSAEDFMVQHETSFLFQYYMILHCNEKAVLLSDPPSIVFTAPTICFLHTVMQY